MLSEIIKTENLSCTEQEFNDYMNSINLSSIKELFDRESIIEKRTFDQLYNDVQIENPTNWKYYYILSLEGRTFLQNIVPFISWLNPLNDDNIDEVSTNHKNQIIEENLNFKKFQLTIEHFKSNK